MLELKGYSIVERIVPPWISNLFSNNKKVVWREDGVLWVFSFLGLVVWLLGWGLGAVVVGGLCWVAGGGVFCWGDVID